MTQITQQEGMPLAEFLALGALERFELIDDTRIVKMPSVYFHSLMIRTIFRLLDAYAQQHGFEVYTEMTFILPDALDSQWVKGSRIPDVALYQATRLHTYLAAHPDHGQLPIPLVPDLVVEVISPQDRYSAIHEKARLYLQDGVRLVWLVDPQTRQVIVYAPQYPTLILEDAEAILSGAEVLPSFQVALSALFAELS